MISGAVFCPQAPLLVPEMANGAAPELDQVRAVCNRLITLLSPGRQVVLLGAGPSSLSYSPSSRGTLAPFGGPEGITLGADDSGGGQTADLPPSLTVGAWLVRAALGPRSGAVAYSIGPDFAGSRAAVELLKLVKTRDTALVVLGDGSARRTVKAPGYLDGRAADFDSSVAAALRSGVGSALEAVDSDLGAQLLAAGVPAWRVAGTVLAGRDYAAELLYDEAPYGVGYFVAGWTARGPQSGG